MKKTRHCANTILAFILLFFQLNALAYQSCFADILDKQVRFSQCLQKAEQNDVDAQLAIAGMYRDGIGVKQDSINALKFLHIVSDSSRRLENRAGYQYKKLAKTMTSTQIQQAVILAYKYLIKNGLQFGIPSNNAFDFWVVVNIYQKTWPGSEIIRASTCLTAANLGNPYAQYFLVNIFQNGGDYLDWIDDKGFKNYEKNSQQIEDRTKQAESQLNLAYLHFHGKQTPQDKQKALYWYKKAAETKQGEEHNGFNTMAMYLVGWMYDTAQGIPQDYKQAFDWYQKAANAGYGDAQIRLADMYQQGQGVTQDKQQAIKWLKTAAEQGYNKAQRILADHYRTGTLVEQNKKQAFNWYKKAAVLEDTKAQYALAQMYAAGEGTDKNSLNAYILSAYLANNYNHSQAKTLCQQLEQELTAKQLTQAKELGTQWQADAKYRTLGVAVEPPFDW